jgi:hypothetical protein
VEMPAPLASIDISRGHASFDRGSLGRAPCSGANACFSESLRINWRSPARDENGGPPRTVEIGNEPPPGLSNGLPLRAPRRNQSYSTGVQLASGSYWAIEAPRAAVFGPRSFW